MKNETIPAVVVILLDGKARIDANWVQRTPDPSRAEDCGATAIAWYRNGKRWLPTPLEFDLNANQKLALELLTACLPQNSGIMNFNDELSTTKADMLALYDRAIDLALSK